MNVTRRRQSNASEAVAGDGWAIAERMAAARSILDRQVRFFTRIDVLSAVNDGDSLLSQQLALPISSVDSCC